MDFQLTPEQTDLYTLVRGCPARGQAAVADRLGLAGR